MRGARARTLGRTLGAGLALGVVIASVGLGACAAIVGVEDVRLRKKDAGDEVLVEEDAETDSGPGVDSDVPFDNVLTVAAGTSHTCARKTDGTVRCWGDDTAGQLGTAAAEDGGLAYTAQVVNIKDAIAIAAGDRHTCVVLGSAKVMCWGANQDGQLGTGSANTSSPIPLEVPGLTARAVACGADFTCAIETSGTVKCWGNGLGGQLGNGGTNSSSTPVAVQALSNVVNVAAGQSHACAVRGDGQVFCWGDNQNGQLGTGSLTPIQIPSPTAVPAISDGAQVAAAERSTCARRKSGAVACWGANEIGQLGSGAANPTPNPTPTLVSNLNASMIWAGANHACAVSNASASKGSIVCWGQGAQGQLGDGQPRDAGAPTAAPVRVSGITSAIGVTTGGNHSCAPAVTGSIQCWGSNARGELGNAKTGQELSPDSVLGFP